MTKQIIKESCRKGGRVLMGLFLVSFIYSGSELLAQPAGSVEIKEKEVIELNKNLKNAIEENQRLVEENKKVSDEMERLRNEHQEGSSRYDELKRERDDLQGTIDQVRGANRQYSQQLKKIEEDARVLESEKARIQEEKETLEKNLSEISAKQAREAEETQSPPPTQLSEEVQKREGQATDLLSRVDAFTEQDERLREDSARAHYNMGNIYFQKGEYEIAVREYYQAVTLMPNDPDAHYNLAYVSSEYLHDYKTALKHYQMYLYLQPNAKDVHLIKEKILESQLRLKNIVDSPLDDKSGQ